MSDTAAILLSRQARRPCGITGWVRGCIDAVRWVKKQEAVLCTSVGMQTWELLAVLACREGVPQRVFVPVAPREDFDRRCRWVAEELALPVEGVEFVAVNGDGAGKAGLMRLRDEAVLDAAGVLIPVSVREGGRFARGVRDASVRGKTVMEDFVRPYESRAEPLKYLMAEEELSSALESVGEGYLSHWTRTRDGPWPGERRVDYYRELLASDCYPRSAFDTLRAILRLGRIVASGTHMPGRIPTVSFTGRPPAAMAPLMRWRSRYQHMSFEPYGIAVEKSWAVSMGARRVKYRAARGVRPKSDDPEAWLGQTTGVHTDWRQEDEWRFLGDFDLTAAPPEALLCFCRNAGEARTLEAELGVRALPYCV